MKRKIDNKKLDEIGKALLTADALSQRDLDGIVSDPALFKSVLERASLERARSEPRRISFSRPITPVFASVAVVMAIGVAFVVLKRDVADVAIRQLPVTPSIATNVTQHRVPDRIVDADPQKVEKDFGPEKVSAVKTALAVRGKQKAPSADHYEGDFYAISYAGDPNETERGGRIVRVDISRSALFAMGVDIPLENETETVKADLLVGNDGVTRAIRVIK